uniref:Gamma-secretase subunit APH-1 n=2 Tax=Anatidae TaxID=8830 RepID=A0A8B9BEK7_9AVES
SKSPAGGSAPHRAPVAGSPSIPRLRPSRVRVGANCCFLSGQPPKASSDPAPELFSHAPASFIATPPSPLLFAKAPSAAQSPVQPRFLPACSRSLPFPSRKADEGLATISEDGRSPISLKQMAYVSGLSFGIISGVFSVINILADSIGPGIVGIHGDSPYYFITSGEAGGGRGGAGRALGRSLQLC